MAVLGCHDNAAEPSAAAHGGGPLRLQSPRLIAAVADLGSLGFRTPQNCKTKNEFDMYNSLTSNENSSLCFSRREILKGAGGFAIAFTSSNSITGVELAKELVLAPIIKELDLRTKVEKGAYFIIFSGRKPSLLPEKLTKQNFSLGGHAYVGWGREDENAQQSYADSFGFYPVEDSLGKWSLILGPIPGEMRRELEKDIDYRLICKISKEDYAKADVIRLKWAQKGQYQLLFEDCTSFVADVASSLGLKSPERGSTSPTIWFPFGYMDSLLTSNPQSAYLTGIWESDDANKRWRLEITKSDCKWVERNQADGTLSRSVQVGGMTSHYRILRSNDKEVLEFSGARASVIPGILAMGPQPSFMTLSRQGISSMRGEWNGLRWTLDAQGKLTGIKQPGTMPATVVNFVRVNA